MTVFTAHRDKVEQRAAVAQPEPRPAATRNRVAGLLVDPRRAVAHLVVAFAIAAGLVLANDAVPLAMRLWVLVALADVGLAFAWRRLSHDTPAEQASVARIPQSGVFMTGSISSQVRLDYDAGTAEKSYRPTRFVRALYRLSFQSPFPYKSNLDALEAARERRRLIGLLTRYWLGENIVAPALDVRREPDGRVVFVTELVRGTAPRDIPRAKALLQRLTRHFDEAGISAWQVAPYNPRSVGNLIERPDGTFRIIDLESNLVTPVVPPRVAVRAIRAGLYPSFDEIDLARLERYLVDHCDDIIRALGAPRAAELFASASAYAEAQRRWHAGERRFASKALRFAFRLVDIPSWVHGIRRLTQGSQQLAENFTASGIATWEAEGRLSPAEANRLRESLALPEVASATGHLGTHMAMSVPLRFPLGSIARSAWTISLRARGEWMALRGRGSARSARDIHSLPVAVVAAVPGLGTFAYTLAKPLRQQRAIGAIALDQSLRHVSGSLYRRLHLDALTLWMARPVEAASTNSLRIARVARSVPGRVASLREHALAQLVVVAAFASLAAAPQVRQVSWFSESDAAFDAIILAGLVAGVTGVVAFRLFWHPRQEARPVDDAAGMFLWAGGAVLLGGMAVDYGLGIHETVFGFTAEHLNVFPMVTNPSEHLVALTYAALALALVAAFRHELAARRASSVYLVVAVVAGALIVAQDISGAFAKLVPALQFGAAAFVALAFTTRLAEVASTLPGDAASDLVLDRRYM